MSWFNWFYGKKYRIKRIEMFTRKEKELIVSALLFTACAEVSNNFDEETRSNLVDIAVLMCADPTSEIEMYKDGVFEEPEIAKKIIDSFAI